MAYKKFLCLVWYKNDENLFESKITRPNLLFYRIHFPILRKLFALTILRIEFGHFFSG
jgi:hypothetical protein